MTRQAPTGMGASERSHFRKDTRLFRMSSDRSDRSDRFCRSDPLSDQADRSDRLDHFCQSDQSRSWLRLDRLDRPDRWTAQTVRL